jgi:hypothetical protein
MKKYIPSTIKVINIILIIFLFRCSPCPGCGSRLQFDDVNNTGNSPDDTSGFTVGGTVLGLLGPLDINLNDTEDLTIDTDGEFTFVATLEDAETYSVTVKNHPVGQLCVVVNGEGTIEGSDITDIEITCDANPYAVGGNVSGLKGMLVLQNVVIYKNQVVTIDQKTLYSEGQYQFDTTIGDGYSYIVTVHTQPEGQFCAVNNSTGDIQSADVTNVHVFCLNSYTIFINFYLQNSGTITLQNLGEQHDLTGEPQNWNSFAFPTKFLNGTEYNIDIISQPANQSCFFTDTGATNHTGTINNSDVWINIWCDSTFTIGGTVTGLTAMGESIEITNNFGFDNLTIDSDGSFEFSLPIYNWSWYEVTIVTPPSTGVCVINNGTGYVTSANVTDIEIICSSVLYTIGGTISGLTGSLTINMNDTATQVISSPALTYSFSPGLPGGANYFIFIESHPLNQTCLLANSYGTVGSTNVTNVDITCTSNPIGGVDLIAENAYFPDTITLTENGYYNPVSAFIRNIGDLDVTNNWFNSGIFFSSDTLPDASDAYAGSYGIDYIAAQSSVYLDFSMYGNNFSHYVNGTYYLILMADHNNSIIELDDTNNFLVSSPVQFTNETPDLQPTVITPSSFNLGTGENFSIDYTLINNRPFPVTRDFINELYFCDSATSNCYWLGSHWISTDIGASGSGSESISETFWTEIPWGGGYNGIYYIQINVDPMWMVTEFDKTNQILNSGDVTITESDAYIFETRPTTNTMWGNTVMSLFNSDATTLVWGCYDDWAWNDQWNNGQDADSGMSSGYSRIVCPKPKLQSGDYYILIEEQQWGDPPGAYSMTIRDSGIEIDTCPESPGDPGDGSTPDSFEDGDDTSNGASLIKIGCSFYQERNIEVGDFDWFMVTIP